MENKLLNELKELERDSEFKAALAEAGTVEAFAELLHSRQVEVNEEEASVLFRAVKLGLENNDELDAEILDTVAGGHPAVWLIAGGAVFLYCAYKGFTSKC